MDNNKYKELKEVAYDRGRKAGNSVFDGNTTTEQYEDFLEAYDACTLDDAWYPTPLSGEWAGESIAELFYGFVDNHKEPTDDELQMYEDAYSEGYWDEVLRWAKHMTQDLDDAKVKG